MTTTEQNRQKFYEMQTIAYKKMIQKVEAIRSRCLLLTEPNYREAIEQFWTNENNIIEIGYTITTGFIAIRKIETITTLRID